MQEVLNHPLFQGAAAPFVVALIVASTFARTRFAWLAVILAYATMIALDTGFSLFPPTVARKTMLIGLLSPLAGIVADTYPRWSGAIATAVGRRHRRALDLGIPYRTAEPYRAGCRSLSEQGSRHSSRP